MTGPEDSLLVTFPFGCNMDCVFCLRNKYPRSSVFNNSAKKWEWLLVRLRALMRVMRRRGVSLLCLGGDEPTMAPGWLLEAVVTLAAKEGFTDIQIMSNGLRLGNKAYLMRLVKTGVNRFSLPVYGHSATIHDSITQKRGSYAALLRAIKHIRSLPGLSLQVHTVLTKGNQGVARAIVSGMKKKGVKCAVEVCREDDSCFQVNPGAMKPAVVELVRQQAVNSEIAGSEIFVRYNICTGEIF